MAIYDDLITAVQDCPEATALEYRDQKISFRNLYAQSSRIAAGLQERDLRRGAAIGVMLPNVPQFLAITYGTFFCGHIVTPISVLAPPRDIAHIMRSSRLDLLFVAAPFLPAVEQAMLSIDTPPEIIVVGGAPGPNTSYDAFVDTHRDVSFSPVHPDQHLLTLYTSGTTGAAKGVMISDQNMRAQVAMIGKTFQPAQGTRVLCVLPLFHAYALNALISMSIRYRTTIVLQDRFEPEACAASLADDGIEWFAGVPTMYGMLLKHGEDRPELSFPSLKVCLTGGAAMNSDVLAGFETRFGAQIYEGYGLTETTVSVASNAFPDCNRKIGSVGRPYPGVETRVLDDNGNDVPAGQIGELVFRGGNVMLGYLNLPDETAKVIKNGWLHSGDLGYVDDDGFCFIVGRKKDLIIKSGYNIVPLEVEDALRQADMVCDACVVGIPDTVRGERILAAVILKGTSSQSAARAQIKATLKTLLAKYKHPNEIWFVTQFPLGPSGKILKKTIRENWLSQAKAQKVDDNVRIPA